MEPERVDFWPVMTKEERIPNNSASGRLKHQMCWRITEEGRGKRANRRHVRGSKYLFLVK